MAKESAALEYQQRQAASNLARKNAAAKQARDVGDIPLIVDPQRREDTKWDVKHDIETYHAEKISLGWCTDHLRYLKYLQAAFLKDRQILVAIAMSRGSGKTTIGRLAVEWAIRHGHLQWPILLEADADAYDKQLLAFHVTFKTKQILADDFPETIGVWQKMSTSQAAPNMTCRGEPMNMVCKTSEIVLPSNYASYDPQVVGALSPGPTAAGIISGGGITSSVRGAQYTLPTGEIRRPDGFICNDPQNRESAHSPKQIRDRIDIISADLLGMGGPGKPMSGVMTMTVIAKNDMADRLLGPEFPQWISIRGKWLINWPINMDLWHQYGALLRRRLHELQLQTEDDEGDTLTWLENDDTELADDFAEVNQFYEANQGDRYGLGWRKLGLDHGAKVYWEARIDPPYKTSLQTFMSWWLISPDAAMAEGQNDPPDPHEPEDIVYASREEILAKQSSLSRYECPDETIELVDFIDVQLDVLIYGVMAVCDGFRRYVVDIGTFPDQKREYWTKGQLSARLSDYWSSPAEGWVEGLRTLTEILDKTAWTRQNGMSQDITHGNIDAAYGASTDSVFKFCRDFGAGKYFPSFGIGVTASKNPVNHGSEQKAWQKRHSDWGLHWNRRPDKDRGCDRYVYDANFWKSQVHIGIRTPEAEPGSLQFFQGDHQLLADHLRAEWPEKTSGKGREVAEWKLRPGQDNDFFDCLSGCGMVNARKIALPGTEGFYTRKATRKRRHITGPTNA